MTTMRAAKTFWEACDGKVSNLSLQKLWYLAHMLELGAGHGPLVSRPFEAWDYGPVEPDLYHKLKAYGGGYVADVFAAKPYSSDDPEMKSIAEVLRQLKGASPAKLVAITHWNGGAWQQHYSPGRRGIVIPDEDILSEYERIAERSKNKAAAAAN